MPYPSMRYGIFSFFPKALQFLTTEANCSELGNDTQNRYFGAEDVTIAWERVMLRSTSVNYQHK